MASSSKALILQRPLDILQKCVISGYSDNLVALEILKNSTLELLSKSNQSNFQRNGRRVCNNRNIDFHKLHSSVVSILEKSTMLIYKTAEECCSANNENKKDVHDIIKSKNDIIYRLQEQLRSALSALSKSKATILQISQSRKSKTSTEKKIKENRQLRVEYQHSSKEIYNPSSVLFKMTSVEKSESKCSETISSLQQQVKALKICLDEHEAAYTDIEKSLRVANTMKQRIFEAENKVKEMRDRMNIAETQAIEMKAKLKLLTDQNETINK